MSLINSLKLYIRLAILRKKFFTSILHEDVLVDHFSNLGKYSVLFKGVEITNSILGDYSYIQSGSVIANADIGKFCSIAGNVNIGLANHPVHMVCTSPVFYDNTQPLPKFFVDKCLFEGNAPRTKIGSDVWIGQGVMIKAGLTIGVGSVIGAGSIVTKDIEPYTLAAGNPCKPIRLRFGRDIVDRLISSEWWKLDDVELDLKAQHFTNPLKLLSEIEGKNAKIFK